MKLIPTKEYEELVGKVIAYEQINERIQDAIDYCNQYCMVDAWGRNVWHAVLDDAIKLRKQNE